MAALSKRFFHLLTNQKCFLGVGQSSTGSHCWTWSVKSGWSCSSCWESSTLFACLKIGSGKLLGLFPGWRWPPCKATDCSPKSPCGSFWHLCQTLLGSGYSMQVLPIFLRTVQSMGHFHLKVSYFLASIDRQGRRRPCLQFLLHLNPFEARRPSPSGYVGD